jgi:two-component system, response regulator
MQYTEILLVEDNPEDAELIINALKKHQVLNKINHVTDGAEALDYVYRRGNHKDRSPTIPRLIILDLKLPKVNGLEVLKTLKSDPETKTIPVVVMTSSQEEEDRIKSYHLGVNSYIVKPLEFDAFVKAVSDLGMYWMLLNESTDNHN